MKRLLISSLLIVLACTAAPTMAEKMATFEVGLAKVNITPDPRAMAVTLNGYGGRFKKPATDVLDPLYARAMVVRDAAGREVALLALDLCFVNSEVRDLAVQRLEAHGIGEHNLMITTTHTHSGPSAYDRRWMVTAIMGAFDQRILDQVVGGIVEAVLTAKQNLQPAVIGYDVSILENMNRSRRDPAFDVATGGSGSITTNSEKYPTDERLTVFKIETPAGKPLGALVHFAAHPTVLSPDSMLISADWPGTMNWEIEKHLGHDAVSMFVNGALGDAAPLPDWSTPKKEIENTAKYGAQIARAAIARLDHTRPLSQSVVAGFTNRAIFDEITPRPLGGMPLNHKMLQLVLMREDQPFQAVRLGHFVILGAPGEPTTLVARSLEELCGKGFHCLTAGPTNGYLGYFVVPEVYDEGGYSADACFWGRDAIQAVKNALRPAVRVVQSGP